MPVDRLSVITEPIITIYVLCGVDPFQLLFETILKNTTGLSVAPEQIVGYELIYFLIYFFTHTHTSQTHTLNNTYVQTLNYIYLKII